MVEPLHIMLFGSTSIHSCPTNLVKIDEWYVQSNSSLVVLSPSRLPFTMSHQDIALVCGLRHALDQLLHKIADNPFYLSSLTSEEQAVVSTVSRLVSQRAEGSPWNPGPSHPRGGYRGRYPRGGYRGRYSQGGYRGRSVILLHYFIFVSFRGYSRGYHHHGNMPYPQYYQTGYHEGGIPQYGGGYGPRY